ncbi:MAG TPA: DUF5996 family protein [Candidatus Dormibacteraeota bacterium]|nr:DUF5996 family protein [Candidatus Dormibacteraeota bacterium]
MISAGAVRQLAEWPELPYDVWRPTMDTLHMKLQIIGKVRLGSTQREPQWANVPLYLTARGLTTSPMWSGQTGFAIDVDLINHEVIVALNDGRSERVALDARPVADFYQELIGRLDTLGIDPAITTMPSEVDNPIPFPEDRVHATYDPEWAHRFWRLLARIDLVLKEHRGRFLGRTSAVSFWWGTFDLAVARYSGRPVQPSKDWGIIRRVGGDAEQCCVGFWPGNATLPEPAFFAYAYPKPEGIENAVLRPAEAGWRPALGEFILTYDAVRRSPDPRQAILDFAESTFVVGATRQRWDPALLVPYDSR